MQKFDVYDDISKRTGGDIYVGVVGPVRTGKSTFISKFVEKLILPNISNKLQKQIATDEMPQSADGKAIMTTQPKFIPANSVKVQFKNKSSANIRLVDCVGYLVDGATGHLEDGKERLVKTPWSDNEISFEKAAEIGTKKVISDYSTIGIVVTTDGSIGEISRDKFVPAEERVVRELKELGKPFIILLNSKNDTSNTTLKLADDMQNKYGVPVICKNILNLDIDDINVLMEKILLEFPMNNINVKLPSWMQTLSPDSPIIEEVIKGFKDNSNAVTKMKDFGAFDDTFIESEYFMPVNLSEIKLGEGVCEYEVVAKDGVFYKVLSSESGEDISDEKDLMSFVKSFSKSRRHYDKVKDALREAEENGYGVVVPTVDEMDLQEPVLVKQGGNYGVKLKASAPSLHIMKINVETEVAPLVGTEKQGEDLCNYLMKRFEDNPKEIWKTDMFGKSLHDLVNEGLNGKIYSMPKDAQGKMRKTITKIVNENKGGVICILL